MQNQRYFLLAIFGLIAYLLFNNWQMANAPKPEPTPSSPLASAPDGNVPNIVTPSLSLNEKTNTDAKPSEKIIHIKTDVLDIKVSAKGAAIIDLSLPKYPKALSDPNIPFPLLEWDNNKYFIAQSGLIGATGSPSFSHADTIFTADKDTFELGNDQDTLVVPLYYTDPETGVRVVKTYEFKRGSYDIRLKQMIENNSSNIWTGIDYLQLEQIQPPAKSKMMGASSYTGPVLSLGDTSYEKIPFDKLAPSKTDADVKRFEGQGGWIAMIQQYFTVAWVPPLDAQNEAEVFKLAAQNPEDEVTIARMKRKSPIQIQPGATYEFSSDLYAGPKLKADLVAVANPDGTTNRKLDLTLDYGWFSPISALMLTILKFFHSFVGNWGWSIMLLTLTVKLILYPLSEKGYRSMAKMRFLAPKLELLKEQYGNDKQKLGQETMALYRKEKINPLGGCLPMLIQIPIFISLFWMLQESVQLRQAPWILWIKDLSVMDPYFILPIIMCFTMWVQQKFNPTPTDPTQAKVMKWMPLIFGFMFMWFAAGIVLYWIVNNTLTILQQWIINKRIESSTKKA